MKKRGGHPAAHPCAAGFLGHGSQGGDPCGLGRI